MVEEKHGKQKILVSFECETLKSDAASEEHLKKYMPNLVGLDAVGRYKMTKKFDSAKQGAYSDKQNNNFRIQKAGTHQTPIC